jgi:hypothetical protein
MTDKDLTDRKFYRAGEETQFAEGGPELTELAQADVGQSVTGTGGLEAADEEALEPGLLDQQRGQRIVRAWQHQGFFFLQQASNGLPGHGVSLGQCHVGSIGTTRP